MIGLFEERNVCGFGDGELSVTSARVPAKARSLQNVTYLPLFFLLQLSSHYSSLTDMRDHGHFYY